jgi:hypothetical protein
MTERIHLRASIDRQGELLDELDRKLNQLAILDPSPGLPHAAELRPVCRRLRPVFDREIGPLRETLADIRSTSAKAAPADSWARIESIAGQVERVAEDVLLFIQGSLVRAAGLEGGICAIVDHLLDGMAASTVPWERTAIPAVREATSNRTWVIGVQASDATIWSLPIVVHEFGHFAVTRLEDCNGERPGVKLVDGSWLEESFRNDDRSAAERFFAHPSAHELFADTLAGYLLGPAYVAALVWRARPHRAWQSAGRHPGWGFRVLAALNAVGADGRWQWILNPIRTRWFADLNEAAAGTSPPGGTERLLDSFLDRVTQVLRVTAPKARFVDEERVIRAEELLDAETDACDGLDVPTVVNAAWIWRIRHGWDVDTAVIGARALGWCRRLAGHPVRGADHPVG